MKAVIRAPLAANVTLCKRTSNGLSSRPAYGAPAASRSRRAVVTKALNTVPTGRVTGERVKTTEPERLDEPANIGACAQGSIEVVDGAEPGSGASLEDYMRLPVEQYVVLDGAHITRLGNNVFQLTVPRLEFFDIWIEPTLEVRVLLQEDGSRPLVVMESQRCDVRGSPLVESMRLNDRFEMFFQAELAWQPGGPNGGVGKMLCKSAVDVWCEVMPPFNLLPRPTLEGGSNAVLEAFTPTMLNLFLRNLSADFAKWAADPAYREERMVKAQRMLEAGGAADSSRETSNA